MWQLMRVEHQINPVGKCTAGLRNLQTLALFIGATRNKSWLRKLWTQSCHWYTLHGKRVWASTTKTWIFWCMGPKSWQYPHMSRMEAITWCCSWRRADIYCFWKKICSMEVHVWIFFYYSLYFPGIATTRNQILQSKFTRLCSKKSWKVPSTLNMWNPGCLIHYDFYEKRFSSCGGAKLCPSHWLTDHTMHSANFLKLITVYKCSNFWSPSFLFWVLVFVKIM